MRYSFTCSLERVPLVVSITCDMGVTVWCGEWGLVWCGGWFVGVVGGVCGEWDMGVTGLVWRVVCGCGWWGVESGTWV